MPTLQAPHEQPNQPGTSTGLVSAVSRSPAYTFSKPNQGSITLLAGLGVEDDAHLGETVKHRGRVKINPHAPNLRQVHLIHAELHDELNAKGFHVTAGQIGENVTTRGIDLLALPVGTYLHLGPAAIVELTGLREPCSQIENFQHGLLQACIEKDEYGRVIRKAGVMSVVLVGGEVKPGDAVQVELPPAPWRALEVV